MYAITGARRSLTEDVDGRQRRYIISMSIRTACFVAAVLVPYGPARFVLVIAALVLPYLAVVMANGGREPTSGPPQAHLFDHHRELSSSLEGDPGADAGAGPTGRREEPTGPAGDDRLAS